MLTASDCAAVLGADPHRGALSVYAAKLGVETEDSLPMRRGRRWEAVIAEEYEEQTGRPVEDLGAYVIQRHPSIEFLGATLDRITRSTTDFPAPVSEWQSDVTTHADTEPRFIGRTVPLQIKMALGSAQHWKDGPPLGYLVQVQVEAACYGSSWAALAGLLGPGPLEVSDHPRNDAFLQAALPKLEAFWSRVQRRDPPPADASPGTTDAIKKLWITDDGTTVALDAEALELAEDMARMKAEQVDILSRGQKAENELRRRIGSATFGALPDGSFLALRKTHVKGHTTTVEPYTYRALRRWWPRLRGR
jgi:predicted phage-related endonuclease